MAHLFSYFRFFFSSSSSSLCPAVTRLSNPPLARHLATGRANEAAREAGGSRGEHRRAASQTGVGQDCDEGGGQAVHTGRQLAANWAVCRCFIQEKNDIF